MNNSYPDKIGVLLIFLIFNCIKLGAQYDGISKDLSKGSEIDSLIERAHFYFSSQPDSCIFLSQKAIQKARQVGDLINEGDAYIEMGLAEMTKGNWLDANEAYRNASKLFLTEGDSFKLSVAWLNLGYSFIAMKQFDKALDLHLKCLRIRENFPKKKLAKAAAIGAIGYNYQNLGEYDKAIEKHLEALELRQNSEIPIPDGIGFVHKNLGIIYRLQKDYQKAEKEFLIALDTFTNTNNLQFVEEMHRRLGGVYADMRMLEKSEASFFQAMEVADQLKGSGVKGRSFGALGKAYLSFGQNQKAIQWLRQAVLVAEKKGDNILLSDAGYQELAKAFAASGQSDSAYYYSQKYIRLQDTLFNEQSGYILAQLKTEYETEQIQQELKISKEREERNTRERNILMTSLGLVILLVLFSFWVNHQRRKAFSALLEEKNKTDSLLEEKDLLLKELREAQTQLVQSEKMASLGQLTAGIAHEINNPINFVTASVEALKMDFQDLRPLLHKILELKVKSNNGQVEEIIAMRDQLEAEYLEKEIAGLIGSIERGALRTKNIVAGLKVFSRNAKDQVIQADLHEGLEATLTILGNELKERITVHKKYGEIPVLSCQFDKLNQVFMNIISNAIEAIEEEGNIYINTYREGENIIIAIKDDGKGMDEITRKHIFEPFYTTKEVGKGTGLGLSISYGIVEQHNGKIEVESTLDKGTTFYICLPVENV